MLKEFSFRNCRSFKDESTLSMESICALKDNFGCVVQRGGGANTIYLNPVSAIYGSNAGGKTNMLHALSDAIKNIYTNPKLWNISYMYDSNVFMHKLVVICENLEYEYQYTGNYAEVLAESLFIRNLLKTDVRNEIFSREGTKIKTTIFKKGDPKKSFLELVASKKESLVMKLAGEVGIEEFAPFYNWCANAVIEIRDLGEKKRLDALYKYATELHNNSERRSEFKKFENFIINFDPSIDEMITSDNLTAPQGEKDSSDAKRVARFVLWHKKQEEKSATSMPFLVESESNGTKKLMVLYPYIKNALESGTLFVCDELDTLLHPLVFRQIVAMFNSKEHNPNGAQLIFTAHNTIVMNRECLRRDEIHFVDKDEFGKSSVFRLSDVVDDDGNKVRMDARYDRLYLAGYFGATPEQFRNASVLEGSGEK